MLQWWLHQECHILAVLYLKLWRIANQLLIPWNKSQVRRSQKSPLAHLHFSLGLSHQLSLKKNKRRDQLNNKGNNNNNKHSKFKDNNSLPKYSSNNSNKDKLCKPTFKIRWLLEISHQLLLSRRLLLGELWRRIQKILKELGMMILLLKKRLRNLWRSLNNNRMCKLNRFSNRNYKLAINNSSNLLQFNNSN